MQDFNHSSLSLQRNVQSDKKPLEKTVRILHLPGGAVIMRKIMRKIVCLAAARHMERGKNPRAGHWEAFLEEARSGTWGRRHIFCRNRKMMQQSCGSAGGTADFFFLRFYFGAEEVSA